jgi:NACalpha-BTF3-like transcription factor
LGNPKATNPKATENRKNEEKEVSYKIHNHDIETISQKTGLSITEIQNLT